MLHPSTKKLIDRLAETTQRGRMEWSEDADNTLIYESAGYRIALTEKPNELVITTVDGKKLEHVTSSELAQSHTDSGVSYTDILTNMAREARRNASGTTAAISVLLKSIASHQEPGMHGGLVLAADENKSAQAGNFPDKPEKSYIQGYKRPIGTAGSSVLRKNRDVLQQARQSASASGERANTIGKDEQDTGEADMTDAIARLANEVNHGLNAGPDTRKNDQYIDDAMATHSASPHPDDSDHKSPFQPKVLTSVNSYTSDSSHDTPSRLQTPDPVSPASTAKRMNTRDHRQSALDSLRASVAMHTRVSGDKRKAPIVQAPGQSTSSSSRVETKSGKDDKIRKSAILKKNTEPEKSHEPLKLWE